jgi:hypothetical protein
MVSVVDMQGKGNLFAFAAQGEGTSTLPGQGVQVSAVDASSGAVAWTTDVAASVGASSTYFTDVSLLSRTAGSNDLVVGFNTDSLHDGWLALVSGDDGSVLSSVHLPYEMKPGGAVVGGMVVVQSGHDVRAYHPDSLADGPVWESKGIDPDADLHSGSGPCALTSTLVALDPARSLDGACSGVKPKIVLDAKTGAVVTPNAGATYVRTSSPDTLIAFGGSEGTTMMAVNGSLKNRWSAPVNCPGTPRTEDSSISGIDFGSSTGLVPCAISASKVDLVELSSGKSVRTVAPNVGPSISAFVIDDRLVVDGFDPAASETNYDPKAAVYDMKSGNLVMTTGVFVVPPPGLGISQHHYYSTWSGAPDVWTTTAISTANGTVSWHVDFPGEILALGNHLVVFDRTSGSFRGLGGL